METLFSGDGRLGLIFLILRMSTFTSLLSDMSGGDEPVELGLEGERDIALARELLQTSGYDGVVRTLTKQHKRTIREHGLK